MKQRLCDYLLGVAATAFVVVSAVDFVISVHRGRVGSAIFDVAVFEAMVVVIVVLIVNDPKLD